MSARDNILSRLAYVHGTDTPTLARKALDAYRDEVLREAAEEIRQHHYPKYRGEVEYTAGRDDGMDFAADLIDPEAEK